MGEYKGTRLKLFLLVGTSMASCWMGPSLLCSSQVQEHKTFHRYTVRARRGTAQSLRDGQTPGSAPRSAGASLRRYNEAALFKVRTDHRLGFSVGKPVFSWS